MKQLLTVIALFCAFAINAQSINGPMSGKYLPINSTGYNWVYGYFRGIGLPSGGPTPELRPGQWTGAGAPYYDTVGHILYVWTGVGWDTVNKAAILGSGVLTSVPGNYGSVLLNRNAALAATDSLGFNSGALINLGSSYIGNPTTNYNARLRIAAVDNMQPLIQAGPKNVASTNFSGGSGEFWDAGATGNSHKYAFWHIDSNVTANNAANRLRFGFWAHRESIMNTATSMTFTFGHDFDWIVKVNGTKPTFNPQNSDGIAAVRNRWTFGPQNGYSGQVRAHVGNWSIIDFSSVQLNLFDLNGAGFTHYIEGAVAGSTSYIISNGSTDTVETYAGFLSTGAATLIPHVNRHIDFLGGTMYAQSITRRVDSSWGFYQLKSHQAGAIPLNFLGGRLAIDTRVAGIDATGPTHTLEIYGSSKWEDSAGVLALDTSAYKIRAVNASTGEERKMNWPVTGGGGGGTPAGNNTNIQINSSGSFGAPALDSAAWRNGGIYNKGSYNSQSPSGDNSINLWDASASKKYNIRYLSGSNVVFEQIPSGDYKTIYAGANQIQVIQGTSTTINYDRVNHDFVVSTIGDGNAIHVKASTDLVGIGTGSPNSKLHVAGSMSTAYVAKTANYTATDADYTIECTANSFTVTLPTAIGITGRVYNIVNSGAGTITVATTSSQTFVNVVATPTSLSKATVGTISVQANGANWMLLNNL